MPVEDPRVRPILGGAGLTWSEIALNALGTLPHRDVLFMIEDFFLTRPVSSAAVEAQRRSLHALGGAYLRLVPLPRPNRRVTGHPGIGVHERGSRFRASLQAAFWDRRTLLDLLRPDESIWDFEREASVRSAALAAPFYATWWFTLRYVNAVVCRPLDSRRTAGVSARALTVDGARPDVTLLLAAGRTDAPRPDGRRGPVAWRVRRPSASGPRRAEGRRRRRAPTIHSGSGCGGPAASRRAQSPGRGRGGARRASSRPG